MDQEGRAVVDDAGMEVGAGVGIEERNASQHDASNHHFCIVSAMTRRNGASGVKSAKGRQMACEPVNTRRKVPSFVT